jgi:nicotinamidase-related amidase
MSGQKISMKNTALLLLDLQNDFIHPDGAYGRAGLKNADIAALPARMQPLAKLFRAQGGMIVATLFTLVSGRGQEPIIAPHLKELRPFLKKGDFAPGSWGQALVDELSPADSNVEKIAYSAFYMSRLEYVLRKSGIERIIGGGIVTNGGVASTIREAHVREFDITVLSDGCAAFSRELHNVSIDALKPVARIATVDEILNELSAAGSS